MSFLSTFIINGSTIASCNLCICNCIKIPLILIGVRIVYNIKMIFTEPSHSFVCEIMIFFRGGNLGIMIM